MSRIEIITDDITILTVDAIVNAANESLLGGGGVDGAIHRAAGSALLAECRMLGGCATGAAKITAGYDLPARHVIHAVGPRWHGGTRDESRLLADCYRQALEIARTHNLKTVAFPAISCGIYGYPVKEAAGIAVREVSRFLRLEPSIEKVYLVCFEPNVEAAYRQVLQLADSYPPSPLNRQPRTRVSRNTRPH